MTSFRGSGFTAVTGAMALGQIRAAWPVAAQPLKATASTVNWLLGRGVPLVVDGGHAWPELGAQTRSLNYMYRVDSIHDTLGLLITMSCAVSGGVIPIDIGGVVELVGSTPTFVYRAYANFGGDVEGSLGLTFAWDGDVGGVTVHNVSLYECPVIFIEESGVENIEPNDLIYDGYDDRKSIAGVERAAEDLRTTYFRRGTVYNWANGYDTAVSTTSTSFQELHPDGVWPAVQTRLMYNGETTRSIKCNVFARVTGGTGLIRIIMTSGDFVDFPITNTSNAWQTTQEINVETDDPSRWDTDGGIRGGTRDEVTILYKAGAGQTVYLLGVSMWDAPGD